VSFRLGEVRFKGSRQVAVGRFFDHVGERLQYQLFGIVDVLQHVQEQIVHRLDVFRKQTHGAPVDLDLEKDLLRTRGASARSGH
jgi:hypothetical protein